MTRAKNFDIQALRVLAVSVTMVAHFSDLVPSWGGWTGYYWLGGGVDLFFAISGFLITGSLLGRFATGDSNWQVLKVFWVGRALRLWPAAITVSTITLLAVWLASPSSVEKLNIAVHWLAGTLQLQNAYIVSCIRQGDCQGSALGHYWSLSLEEQFYLALPLMLVISTRLRSGLIWVFLAIALVQAMTIRPWGSILWFFRTDALLLGSAIALAGHYHGQVMRRALRLPRHIGALMIFLLGALLIIGARVEDTQFYMGVVSCTAGALVLLVSTDSRYLDWSPRISALLSYLADRSYAIYLVHLPIFSGLGYVAPNWFGEASIGIELPLVICALVLTLASADLLHRFVERPGMKLGSKIRTSKGGRESLAGS